MTPRSTTLRHQIVGTAAAAFALMGLLSAPLPAWSSPAVADEFAYPAGQSLNGESGGTGFSAPWNASTDYMIGASGLTFTGLQTSGNAVSFNENNLGVSEALRSAANSGLGGDGTTAWVSFLIRPDQTAGAGVWYFGPSGLSIGRLSVNGTAFYQIGPNGQAKQTSIVPIVAGQTVFVAVDLQFNADPAANDTVTVFFNPVAGASAPGVAGLVENDFNLNPNFGVDGIGANGAAFSLDEVRSGTSYAAVAPGIPQTDGGGSGGGGGGGGTNVPEPQAWTLLIGALGAASLIRAKRLTGARAG